MMNLPTLNKVKSGTHRTPKYAIILNARDYAYAENVTSPISEDKMHNSCEQYQPTPNHTSYITTNITTKW